MPADHEKFRSAAADALEDDAGCAPARAGTLVTAVAEAASVEALEVVAGSAQAFGSALDRRVAMLDRVVRALPDTEPLPTVYEVGVIFRITPAQAANVLRTYEARFAKPYRSRLQSALRAVQSTSEQRSGTGVYLFEFADPAVLDYAVDRLRRRGLTRSVVVDRVRLELVVDRDERDRFGKTAVEALAS